MRTQGAAAHHGFGKSEVTELQVQAEVQDNVQALPWVPTRRSPFAKTHCQDPQRFCLQVAVHDDRILRVEVEDSFCQLKAPGSPGDALKRSQELVDLDLCKVGAYWCSGAALANETDFQSHCCDFHPHLSDGSCSLRTCRR